MPAPKTEGLELRAFTQQAELRFAADEQGKRTATGYFCLADNVTDIGGYWQEKFARGAFAKSLQERDVVALHSHNDGRPVGRKSRDTLKIEEDDRGYAFENVLPDTSDGRDLAVQLERGDIEGMSFRFRALKEEWTKPSILRCARSSRPTSTKSPTPHFRRTPTRRSVCGASSTRARSAASTTRQAHLGDLPRGA